MKKFACSIVAFFAAIQSFSQTPLTTNAEGSEYKFEKVVHLDATPVESQGWTGTCWSFSALSYFETELIRLGKKGHVLSEMYVVYQAYLGKAEKYFRTDGNTNFDEDGAFHDIPWVIQRFGIVPTEAFKGLNYGSESHSHSELVAVLKGAMEGLMDAKKNLSRNGKVSTAWMDALRGILDAYLGEVPKDLTAMKFKVEGKEYNPMTYRDALGLDMNNYVSLTSFTNHDMYAPCQLAIADNWAWGNSYNVPLEDLWTAAIAALNAGHTFAWGADVSEDFFNFRSSLAIVPSDKSTIQVSGSNNKNYSDAGADKKDNCFMKPVDEEIITAASRQAGYDNKQTTDDHGMHAVGIYKDQNGKSYLLVKNSWGTSSNDCDGYFFASEAYFKYKTINIYVHKDALSKDLRKKLNI